MFLEDGWMDGWMDGNKTCFKGLLSAVKKTQGPSFSFEGQQIIMPTRVTLGGEKIQQGYPI